MRRQASPTPSPQELGTATAANAAMPTTSRTAAAVHEDVALRGGKGQGRGDHRYKVQPVLSCI